MSLSKYYIRTYRMPDPFLMCEGFHIDSFGNVISTTFVDLRDPHDRTTVAVLAKGCRKENSIESLQTVRISKPSHFWEYGEGLIRDRGEGHVTKTYLKASVVDDPEDLEAAHVIDAELNRASELLGMRHKITTRITTRTHTKRRSLSFHKYGWLFCASLEPRDHDEERRWKQSMQPDYDHVSYIYRPRDFARALASMAAEQLGPRGKEDELKHTFHGEGQVRTMHKQQVVYHGPVIYSDKPYQAIADSPTELQFMMRSIFVKDVRYRDQREYRFAVLAEKEPTKEEETVDLDASSTLLETMQEHLRNPPGQVFPKIVSTERHASYSPLPIDKFDSMIDIPEPPDVRYGPYSFTPEDPPDDLHELLTEYSGVRALEGAVREATNRRGRGEAQNVKIASAAWHAEPVIRQLCAAFADPIDLISIGDDGLIEITLKFPATSQASGKVVVGPHGTARIKLRYDEGERSIGTKETRWLGERVTDDLRKAGLPVHVSA